MEKLREIWRHPIRGNRIFVKGNCVVKQMGKRDAIPAYWRHKIANELCPGSVLNYFQATNRPGSIQLKSRWVEDADNLHYAQNFWGFNEEKHNPLHCDTCIRHKNFTLKRSVIEAMSRLRDSGILIDAAETNVANVRGKPLFFEVTLLDTDKVLVEAEKRGQRFLSRIKWMLDKLSESERLLDG